MVCAASVRHEVGNPWKVTAHAHVQGCPWTSSGVDCQQMLWGEGLKDPAQETERLKLICSERLLKCTPFALTKKKATNVRKEKKREPNISVRI